jgi:transcriptional regulator with XRE-family HTH domain
MNEIGMMLKKLRGNKSLRDVAKLSGVSYSYISLCERGVSTDNKPFIPTPDVLLKLSQVYECSYVDLMIAAGYIPKTISQSVDLLGKESVVTVGDVVLSEAQKKKLLQMIRVMFADDE